MRLGYYPGCSLHATARDFDESFRAVAGPLGIDLVEIEDWACCGATAAHNTNRLLSIALPARTLALAQEQGFDAVLAPCAACYNRLATARHAMEQDPELKEQIVGILKRPAFTNQVRVISVVELLRDMAATIKEKVVQPLADMKVACYYGCLLVRPHEVTGFDDDEDPRSMEEVVKATGASPVMWEKRLECCGGGFSLSRTASVVRLGRAILEDARKAGAQVMVLACPMCHNNLDFRQKAISKYREEPVGMPILYVTELLGLALGLAPRDLGLHRHYVSPQPVIEQVAAATRSLAGGEQPAALPAPPREEA
ncbi:MAG: CoB--CoM heterodisulfide reductase iron-sulfur subunit B family protein [Bradymonadales bacterium]|nr:CoB--CoM heterodisulfide reductase iron-sulfur subunit B family protein [Bradymonadales bacterium]